MNRRQLLQVSVAATTLGLAACNGTASQKAGEQASSASTSPNATTSAATASGSSSTSSKPVLGLTYIPNVQFAPFYWGVDKGVFAAGGQDIALRHHGAQEGLFTALAAGQEQYVIAGGDELVQAFTEGMELVSIATMYQHYPVRVIVPEDSTITDLTGLKGKRLGIPGKFGEAWFGTLVALNTARLTQDDVTIQTIGYTSQAALTTGKVDAVVGYTNNDAVQFEQNGLAVRELELAPEVPLVAVSLITTFEHLNANREEAQAVAKAMVESMRAVAADPEAAVTVAATHVTGLDEATARKNALATLKATVPLYESDGEITGAIVERTWGNMTTFMKAQGLIDKAVDGASMIDPSVLAS
ncbi:MAG TPA: ABC transporter substrate-binding protein [Candidatus Luteococcus avicola]|nr:ABC transporter substrate-binding protein [Candidatus Luteococcus avicola]